MSNELPTNIVSAQAAHAVVMIRPHAFESNPETAADNAFQSLDGGDGTARAAYDEVTAAADTLRSHGVTVHLFEDDGSRDTPDSVFPNNWFTTHAEGRIAMYPMFAPSRRRERRTDVIDELCRTYRVNSVVDYSPAELDEVYFEGTGVLIFDHLTRTAYVARSMRAHDAMLHRFCADFGYTPVMFDTAGPEGTPVYHTNVIMCIGTGFALVGADYISDPAMRTEVVGRLRATGRDVIELSNVQIGEFAGNALELATPQGLIVAMSSRAVKAMTDEQRLAIESHAEIVGLDVPTIELAGGSVRCMLAGVHLQPR